MVMSKISEAFLEFAGPLIELYGDDVTEEQVEGALSIAALVWNGVVMDESDHGSTHIENARGLLGSTVPPEIRLLFDELVTRRRAEFGSDKRLVGEWEIVRNSRGEANLRVEARSLSSQQS